MQFVFAKKPSVCFAIKFFVIIFPGERLVEEFKLNTEVIFGYIICSKLRSIGLQCSNLARKFFTNTHKVKVSNIQSLLLTDKEYNLNPVEWVTNKSHSWNNGELLVGRRIPAPPLLPR